MVKRLVDVEFPRPPAEAHALRGLPVDLFHPPNIGNDRSLYQVTYLCRIPDASVYAQIRGALGRDRHGHPCINNSGTCRLQKLRGAAWWRRCLQRLQSRKTRPTKRRTTTAIAS